MTDAFTYRVEIEGESNAQFSITMTQQCYLDISKGQFTHEWVLVNLFRALMKRSELDQLGPVVDASELLLKYDWLNSELASSLFPSRH